MTDEEAIQGLWRVTGASSEGKPIILGWNHVGFHGDRIWEVIDLETYADEVQVRSTFTVHKPRIEVRTQWVAPDGTVNQEHEEAGLYQLKGNTLRINWAKGSGEIPKRISTKKGELHEFIRETDPELLAAHREPPRPLERAITKDRLLGSLRYHTTFHWWEGSVQLDGPAELHIDCPDADDPGPLERARTIVRTVKKRLKKYKQFVAWCMLSLKNVEWRGDDEEIDTNEFVKRLEAETLAIDDEGMVQLYFCDGGLFMGHSITVALDENLEPTRAGLSG